MKVLTVEEAVEKVNKGESLKGYVLDQATTSQVNVRDAMVLNTGGIVIPEENLFYDDDEIEYDEDIDELLIGKEITGMSWSEKAKRASEYNSLNKEPVVNLSTEEPEINDWILLNRNKLEDLLKPIVVNLFNAEKALKE